MNTASTIHLPAVAAMAALLLVGCAGQTRAPEPAAGPVPPPVPAREGRLYQAVPEQSLLTILVYRAGTLARMGHNHVVASHDLLGEARVPQDLTRASFELRIPVGKLTVDERELRTEAGSDFPPEVPDSAKEGTRRNMLSAALLDAERYPEIVLRSQRIDVVAPNALLVQMQVTVRDQSRSVTVPVHYELNAEALSADGEFSLQHSELGLTPFSAMMGAMQVQDEMRVRFKLHFSAAPETSAITQGAAH